MAKFTFDFDVDGIIQDIESEIMNIASEEQETEEGNSMFHKLPSNSEKILDEIISSDNPTEMLANRFREYEEQQNFSKDEELRGILDELIELGYIEIAWGDNIPDCIRIKNSARTYPEQLEEYNRERTAAPVQVVNNNYTFNIADASALHEIISKIRKEAQKVEDNAALLKAIDELEQSIGKPSFFQKYQSFISSAANHVTFFGGIASAIKTISNLLSM
nr:hypothetical protein [uncultured Dysosmobacter sp.]